MAAPSFWAFSIQPGARLQQQVPKGASICLTGATLADPSNQRTVLTASVGGVSAVLCNLFGRAGHEVARLGQPFHEDFELSVSGGKSAVHVSGFARGDLGPAELLKAVVSSEAAAEPAEMSSSAQRARAAKAEEEEEDDEEGEEEDEGDYEDAEGEEEGALNGEAGEEAEGDGEGDEDEGEEEVVINAQAAK